MANTWKLPHSGALVRLPGPIEPDLRPSSSYAASYWLTVAATLVAAPALVYALGGSAGAMVFAAVILPAPVALIVDRAVLARRAARIFNEAILPGLEALSRGRLDEAEAVFRAVLQGSRGRGGLQAIALFNIAAVRARRGDSEGAVRILFALHRYAPTKRAQSVAVRIPASIALHLAQLGDVAEARRWLAEARATRTPIKLYTSNVEALILTREGKYAEACAVYDKEWPDIERVIGADVMRGVRARRAFAIEMAGGDPEAVRRLVEGARPEAKGELAHLGEAWDEMRAFLEKHGLV